MPCTFVCLTPVIIGAWPSILPCLIGAASTLGLTVASSVKQDKKQEVGENVVEVELENSSVQGGSKTQNAQFIREGLTFTINTNECGRLVVRVQGKKEREHLREKAKRFAGAVSQIYAYHRAISELKQKGFSITEENLTEDSTIHITLRRW